jgi:hypothetical protein
MTTKTQRQEVLAPEPPTPMAMISQALAQGAGIDVVRELMALKKEWEADEARKAFSLALAQAKAEIEPIKKTARVYFKGKDGKPDTDYWHETLDDIERAVVPILSRYGLGYRFAVSNDFDSGKVTVGCVLFHSSGHEVAGDPITSKVDTSGSKDHIKAIGSAITYISRYTLKAALGLAAAKDDDGTAAGITDAEPRITEEQVADIRKWLAAAKRTESKLCDYLKVDALSDLPASRLDEVKRLLGA